MSIFNIYNEIEKEYENLIPHKREGLVLFHLYKKQKDGDIGKEFSEDEIIKSLTEIRHDLKTDQKEQFNTTIKRFQKYFLWRDEKNRLYSFKFFAEKWCILIENTLEEVFNPTQLQKEFLYLDETLNRSLKDNQFEEWYNLTYQSYSQKVDAQINALYIQVDRLVGDFRRQISDDHTYNLDSIKKIVGTLDDIRSKTEELNNAFNGAHNIQSKLLKDNIIAEDILLNSKRAGVLSFFKDIRKNLNIISHRIDSVRPRLNEYIRDTNRHDFYKQFKQFFDYILKNSTLEKRQIHFPEGMRDTIIPIIQQPKFIIVKENLKGVLYSRFKTAKLKVPVINNVETEKRLLIEREKIEIQKRINNYLLDFGKRLEMHNEVDFSDFFYEILRKENIRVCVKLAHKTMSKYHNVANLFGISIYNTTVSVPEYPTIKIWKTIIYKK